MGLLKRFITGGPGATQIYDEERFNEQQLQLLQLAKDADRRGAKWGGRSQSYQNQMATLDYINRQSAAGATRKAAENQVLQDLVEQKTKLWAATGTPISEAGIRAAAQLGYSLPPQISESAGTEGVPVVRPMSREAITMASAFGNVSDLFDIYNSNQAKLPEGVMLGDDGTARELDNFDEIMAERSRQDANAAQRAIASNKPVYVYDRINQTIGFVSEADLLEKPDVYQVLNKPAEDFQWGVDEDGRLVSMAIPGTDAFKEKTELERTNNIQVAQDTLKADAIYNDLIAAQALLAGDSWVTGIPGWIRSAMGSSDARTFEGILDSLKSNIVLDNMKAMKALSPTGSTGFGAMNEKESGYLEAQAGKLDTMLSEEALSEVIDNLMDRYLKTVYPDLPEGLELPSSVARSRRENRRRKQNPKVKRSWIEGD